MFPPGTKIRIGTEQMRIGQVLGQGGEGTVVEVEDSGGTPVHALKWYFDHTAKPERRRALSELVRRGSPHERFLWPTGLIDHPDGKSFGYLMPIRPPHFAAVSRLLALRVPRREPAVVHLVFETAHSFLALHAQGLCYRDINFGNLFFDPMTGEALVCDNDNVGVDGASPSFIKGSPKFMAPEVLVDNAAPSKRTDQYSLAVMLFYLLLAAHPLEGRLTETTLADRAAHLRFYGYEPRFCLDPDDASNEPMPGFHDHVPVLWDVMPGFVRNLFLRSFTLGLRDPEARVTDSEWCDAALRMRDLLASCPSCEATSYVDPARSTHRCPHCHTEWAPLLARVDHQDVAVTTDFRLIGHHLRRDFDAASVYATAEMHPIHEHVMGICNRTTVPWSYRYADGRAGSVEPGARVKAEPGLRLTIEDRVVVLRRP